MSKTVQSISDPQCNDSVFLKKSTALYVRVSTDRQALEGESLRAQEEILKEYCKNSGISEYKIYRDEGCSAKQKYNKRPVMMKLLSDIEAGKIHQVLFIKLDRWMRNVAEYHKVQEILDRNLFMESDFRGIRDRNGEWTNDRQHHAVREPERSRTNL